MIVRCAALLWVLAVPLLSAAQGPSSSSPAEAAEGQRLFMYSCAGCHGPAGEGGKGPTLALPELPRAADLETLTTVIRRGLEGTEMPGTRLTDAELGVVAEWVLALGRRPLEQLPGDPARGEQLYATKGGCAACHTIQGRGGAFGPDLSDIGRRRGAPHLRQSLLEPDADLVTGSSTYRSTVPITQNFLLLRVTTRDGRELSGVRVNEDSFSIQFRDVSGAVHSFFKSELRELHKDWGRSPMPPYGQLFSPDELEDVVAYLLTRRGT